LISDFFVFVSIMSELAEKNKLLSSSRSRRRKSKSYRKSREVTVVGDDKDNKSKTFNRSLSKIGRRWNSSSRSKRCPKAPHNTTSFLMNFHKSETKQRRPLRALLDVEDDCDSIGKGLLAYGSFFPKFKTIPADMSSLYSLFSQ
jgi:hypothetical protein